MREYPEAEVDRIIAEEVMRAEGTRKWYGPVARTRIKTVLMSRLCATWNAPAARRAIEAVAAAETKLLYLCTTKEVKFVFVDESYHELIENLLICDNALGLTIAAHASWPIPSVLNRDIDVGAGLEAIREEWAHSRQELQAARRQGQQVAVHGSVFVKMHGALQAGYMVFVTPDEYAELHPQFERALKRLTEHRELFFAAPNNPIPRA